MSMNWKTPLTSMKVLDFLLTQEEVPNELLQGVYGRYR